jgi:hypothetical protein
MATILSARQAGEQLDLEHTEVIRRIRNGDIVAKKMGWNWVVQMVEVEAVRDKDWYKKLMARRAAA